MRRIDWIKRLLVGILLLTLVCLANNQLKAQAEPLKKYVNSGGKIALPNTKKSSGTFTGYYLESEVQNDSIWVSTKGKYYVKRISKKTGNTYYKYLKLETK